MSNRRLTIVVALSLAVQIAMLVALLLTWREVQRVGLWAENVCNAVESVRDAIEPPVGFLGPHTNCLTPQ